MRRYVSSAVLAAAIVLGFCVLSFYETTSAAPPPLAKEPFANAIEQRAETVALLRDIKDLLREQNELLRSGQLQVVIRLPEKR